MTYQYGIPTSLQKTGQQWDFPDAWAPLQDLVIRGREAAVGRIPGPAPLASRGSAPWYWGGVNRGCEGFLWLFCSHGFPLSRHLCLPPPVQGTSPPFSLQTQALGKEHVGFSRGFKMEVLRLRPLSLLEESKVQAYAPSGLGTQVAQGPAWSGVGSRSGQVSFTSVPGSGFPAGSELDPNQL